MFLCFQIWSPTSTMPEDLSSRITALQFKVQYLMNHLSTPSDRVRRIADLRNQVEAFSAHAEDQLSQSQKLALINLKNDLNSLDCIPVTKMQETEVVLWHGEEM